MFPTMKGQSMYSDGNQKMLAGAGRTDITPPPDCILAGFAVREHEAAGIHDNLTATALALSSNGETAVIVGLDLISISQEHLDSIRKTLGAAYGLKPDRLLVISASMPTIRIRGGKSTGPARSSCSGT